MRIGFGERKGVHRGGRAVGITELAADRAGEVGLQTGGTAGGGDCAGRGARVRREGERTLALGACGTVGEMLVADTAFPVVLCRHEAGGVRSVADFHQAGVIVPGQQIAVAADKIQRCILCLGKGIGRITDRMRGRAQDDPAVAQLIAGKIPLGITVSGSGGVDFHHVAAALGA